MKRQGEENQIQVISEKRAKHELFALDNVNDDKNKQLLPTQRRTSKLDAAILQLSGHSAEVNCCKFHPNGETLVSAGFDRQIMFWNVYGEIKSYALLKDGHKGAVLDVQYSGSGDRLFTTSTDKSLIVWDVQTCARIKKLQGHSGIVNACSTPKNISVNGNNFNSSFTSSNLIASASDDRTAKVWDCRQRHAITTFKDDFQLTSVVFNDTGSQLFTGSIDNHIKCYDLRKKNKLYTLIGHLDTITGLSLSPDGSYILSNSMDNSLRIWDIRPFVNGERCTKILNGAQHNFEKNLLKCSWSLDGKRITCGSADRFVNIWDVYSRKLLYKLPGHNGSVNEVVFHPNEPIILSCSSDRTMFLGEIE